MSISYVIGTLLFLIVKETLSTSLELRISDEKQYQNYECSFECVNSQLAIMKSEIENLCLQIAQLEEKLATTEHELSKNITEVSNHRNTYFPSTAPNMNYQFELIKQTQRDISIDLKELKTSIFNLSISNEMIAKNVTRLLTERFKSELTSETALIKQTFNNTRIYHRTICSDGTCLPNDCAQATALNGFKDDMYLINPCNDNTQPFYVYCMHEMPNSKAWTIIQRREDGSENFNRNWLAYKHGFGDIYGEYWIGLERISTMTQRQPYELWITLESFNNTRRNAYYKNFAVANETEYYKLAVSGYRGDAGDSFTAHNGMKFSTFDRNNNPGNSNCAQWLKGGWWYTDCFNCNLNGMYYTNCNSGTVNGINWISWLGVTSSMKSTHMAIRPID